MIIQVSIYERGRSFLRSNTLVYYIPVAENINCLYKGITPQKGATPLVNRNLNKNLKFKNICFILLFLLIAEKQ